MHAYCYVYVIIHVIHDYTYLLSRSSACSANRCRTPSMSCSSSSDVHILFRKACEGVMSCERRPANSYPAPLCIAMSDAIFAWEVIS